MTTADLPRRITAEAIGTAMLLAAVVGSGIMAERLSGGNDAIALAAYWFTASTSFANPAVTLARALTDTFAGIRPADVPGFIVAQLAGAATATLLFRWLVPSLPQSADRVVVPRAEVSAS